MKKYTYYKVGLFISLLGFGTLASCVNARQELGFDPLNPTRNFAVNRYYNKHPITKPVVYTTLGSTLFISLGGVIYWLTGSANQSSALTTSTCPVTPTGGNIIPHKWNIAANKDHQIEELTRSVYKAIESGTQKWDKADSSLIDQFTEDVNRTMAEFREKQASEPNDNFAVPYTISDPKVLDKETLENIKQARCEPNLIKCLISKGLDPNAKDAKGVSLLTLAVVYDRKDALTFLIGKQKEGEDGEKLKLSEINSGVPGADSLLELAIVLRNEDISKYLIQEKSVGFNIQKNENAIKFLKIAASAGNGIMFKELLDTAQKDKKSICNERSEIEKYIDTDPKAEYKDTYNYFTKWSDVNTEHKQVKSVKDTMKKSLNDTIDSIKSDASLECGTA
ncbi:MULTISPECIES: ankyrin repeat domain-containing protein [unclassified Candidatus Cardinium]|uniref:ankyrin repeat domain-containing protein n=1 Tax=unclassified Candidatus Cardinium TaxID=2641185 RepID=UPI001FB1B0A8|nr:MULTISPECIES: ankyrin repeat domain-containing protein [unclassified Candidatus Cardinium]